MKYLLLLLLILSNNIYCYVNIGDNIIPPLINDQFSELRSDLLKKGVVLSYPDMTIGETINSSMFNHFFEQFAQHDNSSSIVPFIPGSEITAAAFNLNLDESMRIVHNKVAYKSCNDILANGESEGDGDYLIDVDGNLSGEDAIFVYCDMTNYGGGWTKLIQHTPAGTHPAFQDKEGYNYIKDAASDLPYVSKAYWYMSNYSHLRIERTDMSESAIIGDIQNCLDNSGLDVQYHSLGELIDRSGNDILCSLTEITESPSSVNDFTINKTHSLSGCNHHSLIGTGVGIWDGGASASIKGIGSSGYKTNNSTNCGSVCVHYSDSCLPEIYNGESLNPYGNVYVRDIIYKDPRSCQDLYGNKYENTGNDIYTIDPDGYNLNNNPYLVYCDLSSENIVQQHSFYSDIEGWKGASSGSVSNDNQALKVTVTDGTNGYDGAGVVLNVEIGESYTVSYDILEKTNSQGGELYILIPGEVRINNLLAGQVSGHLEHSWVATETGTMQIIVDDVSGSFKLDNFLLIRN